MSSTNESSPDNVLQLTTAEIIPLGIYTSLATVLGLFGNILVIYSSVRYNAIKLDKVSLIFIQNLAVADLLYILCNVLPSAITYIVRRYVLGEVLCFINAVISFIPGSVNTLTVLALTAYKLLIVLCPFKAISTTAARTVVSVIWLLSPMAVILHLVSKSSAVVSETTAGCQSSLYESKTAWSAAMLKVILGGVVILPLVAITIFNAILCVISITYRRRITNITTANTSSASGVCSRSRKKNRPLLTVCLLSGFFIASWAPYVVYMLWKSTNPNLPRGIGTTAYHAIQLNSFVNPILYTFTNKRFAAYVRGMFTFNGCATMPLNIVSSKLATGNTRAEKENLKIEASKKESEL